MKELDKLVKKVNEIVESSIAKDKLIEELQKKVDKLEAAEDYRLNHTYEPRTGGQ